MSLPKKVLQALGLSLNSDVVNIDDREEVLEGGREASAFMGAAMNRDELLEARAALVCFLSDWDLETLREIDHVTNGLFADDAVPQNNLRHAIEVIIETFERDIASRS